MSNGLLDEEEMAAVRSQMVGAARARSAAPAEAANIPLIADDRAAERARPIGMALARRIFGSVQVKLRRWSGVNVEPRQLEAPIVDAESLRDVLKEGWSQVLEVEAPVRGYLIMGVNGPLLSVLAMRLLGATGPALVATRAIGEDPAARAATPATRRLFAPMGERLRAAVCDVLGEEHGYRIKTVIDPERAERVRRELSGGDVVAVTIGLGGDGEGCIRLIGRPELLVPPTTPLLSVQAPIDQLRRVLGDVPVEVRVELGTINLSCSDLSHLRPGDMLPLEQSADGLIRIFVGGVACALGRPLVSGGSLAVEIADPTNLPKENS